MRGATGSSVTPRVVAEFLAQMQGVGDTAKGALLVLGATNLPWSIDPAALRPGRFDELIYVGLPNAEARLRLLELNLAGRPLDPAVDLHALAERTSGYSGADIAHICLRSAQRAFLDEVQTGAVRAIDTRDVEAVLAEVKPSVTPATLARLEKFRAERAQQS